jgi:hypothetical protein
MAERIIALRPHHIERFVSHHYSLIDISHTPGYLQGYGDDHQREHFAGRVKTLFNELEAGGTGEEFVLVRNGLDDICNMCPVKRETCSAPDSLDLFNGSGLMMQSMGLREGFLYPLKEFLEKVKILYPDRNWAKV